MTDFFNGFYFRFYFMFIALTSVFVHAQTKKSISDIEKVYLHTDRSTYFMGEDLWYKAYNVRAFNNQLFDNSNILYVELISSDSKIIARHKTNLETGLGNGDFKLADSVGIKPGRYHIRAYTNWNRNFGNDFVFQKDIEVFNVFDTQGNAKLIKNQNEIKTDFFPEGGSLLENVAGIVGFKAIDSSGNPIEIEGEVFDSGNEWVTAFSSNHDGMGKFQIMPVEGKRYYAKIKTSSGQELRKELPNALKQGYSLNFRSLKGKNIITINANQATLLQNPNQKLTLIYKTRGISYLETTHNLTEATLSFELPKNKIPEGICQITLYDSNNIPQSERLIYIENEHNFEVQLTIDKPVYKPNEKTTISVTSKSKDGVGKAASFSLSVTDMNGILDDKDYGTNICSYYLMESDIKGKVHNPGYYFDTTNSKRLEHLDNLLLTQGWRDFLWKTSPNTIENIDYTAEKGITISGRVKQLLGEKPLVNNNMTLALMNKKHFNFFNASTDSFGVYKFENIMFSGKTTMYLNSRNEKGKFRGEIIPFPIEQPPLPVLFKNDPNNFSEAEEVFMENVHKKFVAFGVKPENILKEVAISSQKKNSRSSMLGIPEFSYAANESTALFTDIYQLIEQNIPGTIANGNSVRFVRFEAGPLFIIDGIEVIDDLQVDFILPADVVKIEGVKGSGAETFYGPRAASGVIAITTKGNTGNQPKKESLHSIKKEIEGFYTARIFYVSGTENTNLEPDNKTAVRNTIYWNPYVHPDKTGNVSVNYFNSSVETKVKVALEGISGSGIPIVKKIYYNTNK